MNIKNVVVIGGGVLGSQIALQSAYCGFDVTIWLRSEASIKRAQPKLERFKKDYIDAIKVMATDEGKELKNWCFGIADYDSFNEEDSLKRIEEGYMNLKIELDLKKAVENADLVIEAMSENLNEKKELYKKMAPYLSSKTIVVTNSSTLLPSKLAKYTGREEKFLALHFANSIWKNNMAEVMMQKKTNEVYFNEVIDFAKAIRMIPLPIKKEKSGYLLNSMLVPLLFSGMDLYVNGISDPKSIDSAWKLGTGAPKGPFEILDTIGIKTAYNVVSMYAKIPSFLAPYNFKAQKKLLGEMIKENKLGIQTKEGFYKY